MSQEKDRDELIEILDASIGEFNRDGRLGHRRATRRARRLTGLDWTYSALMLLEGMKEDPSLRMSQLAGSLGIAAPTVTKLVRDLEQKGLLQRSPDGQDGRASVITLTEKGLQVAREIGHARLHSLEQVLSDWDDEDLTRFNDLFGRLRADMRRMT